MNRLATWFAPALITITVIAYLPAIRGGFIWDDDDYVTENPTLGNLSGLKAIWLDPSATPQYYPLVHTSFWIEHQLWGLWASGYHIVNVLIHACNAIVLWRLLVRLSVPGSWLIAMIFALHPVHVESVAWITERKNVLSGLFYLASMHCFLSYWDFCRPAWSKASLDHRWYALAHVFFLAALWSKTVAATLPAALLVLIWWKRGRITRAHVVALLPMFLMGIGLGLLTVWLEKHHVGAQGIDWELSIVDRCLIAGRAIVFYASKLLWPAELIFTYPRWTIDSSALWQYAFPAGVVASMVTLWVLRNRLGRGPLAAICLFAGTLFPALGFFDVYPMRFSFVADHFQYMASIGLIALVVAALWRACQRTPRYRTACLSVVSAVVIVTLAGLTWRQGRIYEGVEVLWRDTLAKNPASFMAHNNLGALLNDRQDYAEAESHLRKAVALKPTFVDSVVNLAKSREGQGDLDEARALYEQATRIDPNFAPAFNGLGAVHGMQGNNALAEQNLKRALQLKPDYATAYANLATLFSVQGKLDQSIEELEKAIELDPEFSVAKESLARVYLAKRDFQRAEALLQELVRDNPRDVSALLNLGVVAANQERYSAAIGYFERVLRIDSRHLQAIYNLGAMHDTIGNKQQAEAYFRSYQRLSGTPPPGA